MMASGTSDIRLQFLSNESEEDEGLGHAGIETYRAKPYAGAAREVGQNSRDVAVTTPVRLAFDLLEIPLDAVPDAESLRQTVDRCLPEAIKDHREKEKAFFTHAKALLARDAIKVLRIADYNTTGARGPAAAKGTPFYSLTRANGVSAKDREDSGGSYGIGKNAAFAISDLRTVFYSTIYHDEVAGRDRFLALGKSVLVSHHDENGKPLRQIGYWALPRFGAVEDPSSVPEWLRRKQRGTSVYVLGFREEPNWQHRFASALLANFFPAIHDGQMEFTVDDGKIAIGRETLPPLFASTEMLKAAEANGHLSDFKIAQHHYRCLTSPEARDHDVTIPSLGKVRIRVLVAEGLPKKICITRNGLVITDSLKNFDQPFARFPMYQDFSAVITPLDSIGSAFIKKLEDPKHEDLSPEGLPDEQSRQHARRVIKKLGNEIREAIKADSFVSYSSEVAADEMRNYFAAESEPNRANRTSEDDDPETVRYKVEPRRPKKRTTAVSQPDDTAAEEVGTGGGPGAGLGPGGGDGGEGPGPQSGSESSRPFRPIKLEGVRIPAGAKPEARIVYFTPDGDGLLNMTLEAVGVNENELLTIISATGAAVASGAALVSVKAGQRTRVDVELSEAYDGPVEIRARLVAPQVTP